MMFIAGRHGVAQILQCGPRMPTFATGTALGHDDAFFGQPRPRHRCSLAAIVFVAVQAKLQVLRLYQIFYGWNRLAGMMVRYSLR